MQLGRRELLGIASISALSVIAPSAQASANSDAIGWLDSTSDVIVGVAKDAPVTLANLHGIKGLVIDAEGFEKHAADGGYTATNVHDKIETRLREAKIKIYPSVEESPSPRKNVFSIGLVELRPDAGGLVFNATITVGEIVFALRSPGRRELAFVYIDAIFGISPDTTLPDAFASQLDSAMDRFLLQYSKDNP